MKKYFVVLLILISTIFLSGYKRPDKFHIDAITNASRHNVLGTEYVRERCYYAAIQEFKIAISLNPDSQASSVYYNNLGEVYMKLGFPVEAQDCFERALKLYGLNFLYYQNLVSCYKQMKQQQRLLQRLLLILQLQPERMYWLHQSLHLSMIVIVRCSQCHISVIMKESRMWLIMWIHILTV